MVSGNALAQISCLCLAIFLRISFAYIFTPRSRSLFYSDVAFKPSVVIRVFYFECVVYFFSIICEKQGNNMEDPRYRRAKASKHLPRSQNGSKTNFRLLSKEDARQRILSCCLQLRQIHKLDCYKELYIAPQI